MLLTVVATLALAQPSVKTKGDLPLGPLIAWSVEKDGKFNVRARAPYEANAKNLTLIESDLPLDIEARDGRNGLIVVEHGEEQRKTWKIDVSTGDAEELVDYTPAASKLEERPICKDLWPPRNAGTWSLYLDSDDKSKLARVQAFGFRSHRPKTYEDGQPVVHEVAGLLVELEGEHLVQFKGEDEIIWGVTKAGVARKVATLGDTDIALLSAAVVSPDGSMLAVGAFDREDWSVRRVLVLDLKTGEMLMERKNVRVAQKGTGDVPVMKIVWASNDRLRFSETIAAGQRWVEVAVPTGEETWEQIYTSVAGSRHRIPPGAGCRAVYVDGGHVRNSVKGSIILAGSYKPDSCRWSVAGDLAVCTDDQWMWVVDGDLGGANSFGKSTGLRSLEFLP